MALLKKGLFFPSATSIQCNLGKRDCQTQMGLYSSLNHPVAPKAQALKCNACHSPDGVLNFKELGYAENPSFSALPLQILFS